MVYFNNTSSQLCKAIIYWVSFSGGLFEAMDTLYDSYFHFCCELVSIGKLMLEPGFRVHDLDHTHSLASCKIVTTLNWKLLTVLEMEPLQRQRRCPFVLKRRGMTTEGLSTANQSSARRVLKFPAPPPILPSLISLTSISPTSISPTSISPPLSHFFLSSVVQG